MGRAWILTIFRLFGMNSCSTTRAFLYAGYPSWKAGIPIIYPYYCGAASSEKDAYAAFL